MQRTCYEKHWQQNRRGGDRRIRICGLEREMARQAYECATVTVTVDVAVRPPASETLTQ